MFTRLPVDASDLRTLERCHYPQSSLHSVVQGKKITLKIHKKSRFQPNEKIFAESCSVRYKDLLRAKKLLGVIGT